MRRICVYCGSSIGAQPVYAEAAKDLGRALVEHDLGLVYGGGKIGLMGTIAQAVLDAGGEVIGAIPELLMDVELALPGLTELHVVGTMHERKALMIELADGFISLPGGFGTFDEMFELLTWAQLGIHNKPFGLLNVNGYYDKLMDFINHATEEQFVKEAYRPMLMMDDDPDRLLARFATYQPPQVIKWKQPAG